MTAPSDPQHHQELQRLFAALVEEEIQPDEMQHLEAILLDDAKARQSYYRYMSIHADLSWRLGAALAFDQADGLQTQEAWELLLTIESDGEDLDPMALAAKRFPPKTYEKPSKHDWAMAGRYVLEHYITPKRVAIAAAAALIVLAASLLVFFLSGDPGVPVNPVATNLPETRSTPELQPAEVVASITDQFNARWRYGDLPVELSVGTTLSPQQRLTLTHGFAQITTQRGAKVLMQAPSTFELTDSDNAIRLHRGKLVGRCDTAESEGFTVHAPGMDVVDLGTEFGVEADEAGVSAVFVMEGSVRAQPTLQSPHAFEPVVLVQSQARRVVPETGGLEMVAASEAPVFFHGYPDAYVNAVRNANPVAYWRFDHAEGKTITNEAQPGRYDLRATDSAAIDRDGFIGGAGRINAGAGSLGAFDMSGALDAVSDSDVITFECWFRAESVQQGTLLSLYQDDPTEIKHILNIELQPEYDTRPTKSSDWTAQSIRAAHCTVPDITAAAGTNIYSSEPYTLKSWHHVVVVKESEQIRLYLDGRRVAESATGLDIAAGARLSLGRTLKFDKQSSPEEDMSRPLDGWIDEVAVYNRSLDANEVMAHWYYGNHMNTFLRKE